MAILLAGAPSGPLKDSVFSCKWDRLKEEGGPESGEFLDAWSWEKNGLLVMIGTEDCEVLNARLNLSQECTRYSYPVEMFTNEVRISIEDFPQGQHFPLHFVVAWNPLPEAISPSCWFAVDVPHERVRAQCQGNGLEDGKT